MLMCNGGKRSHGGVSGISDSELKKDRERECRFSRSCVSDCGMFMKIFLQTFTKSASCCVANRDLPCV